MEKEQIELTSASPGSSSGVPHRGRARFAPVRRSDADDVLYEPKSEFRLPEARTPPPVLYNSSDREQPFRRMVSGVA